MIALPLSYVLIIAHTITVMYNWFFNNTLGKIKILNSTELFKGGI